VNLAKITCLVEGLPPNPGMLRRLQEMGRLALGMVRTAMDALARRDLELARRLPELDDPIDELNRGTGQFREFTDASHPEVEHPELLQRGPTASSSPTRRGHLVGRCIVGTVLAIG
jgi:PhoU domain